MYAQQLPRIEQSIPVHRGRVFDLYRDRLRLPDGRSLQVEIIRHPGAAAIVALDDRGEVLLLHQHRHATGGPLWEIPAGTANPGEPALDCARRELEEETGFGARSWEPLGTVIPAPGYSSERVALFLARGLTRTAQNLDPDEILEVCPTPMEAALEMVWGGVIQDGKTIAGLCLAWHRLGGPEGCRGA
jgi:ADP-ribose pyrophosphatase